MNAPAVSIQSVTKRFPGVVALSDVSVDIASGSFHSICGENGAGKSTLMKILSGVITDYEGKINVAGKRVRFSGTRDAEAAGISIIHQELNLVEELSAAANIFLGREKRNSLGFLADRAMEDEASALFADLDCDIQPGRPVSELRVGDQQLVEIAKALSLDANILIMDEPTSALTESEVERLCRVIEKLRSRGTTILYISHKMDEIFRLSDRITILRDGQHVQTMDCGDTDRTQVTHLMVGRELEDRDPGADRVPGAPVLEVRNLKLPWPGHARDWRLEDISFTLKRSEVIGIAGLMGAGRTELMECLFGASPQEPTGTILLDNESVFFHSPAEAKAAGIALVTEDRKRLGLFAQMNVRENITICTLDQQVAAGLIGSQRERTAADSAVQRLGVKTPGTEVAITSLSGGNQQKCIIARWLETNPKVLLLDDPTRGVDVGAKAELYRVIDELCRDGLGIIVTSSELPELITVCDRILVLCEGRLTGELSRDEFSEERIMELATMTDTSAAT